MMGVLSVFGTRPEAIKMAPVVNELAAHPGFVDARVCVTGQHREMVRRLLTAFNIRPDYDLDVMTPDQSLSQVAARILRDLDDVIVDFKPEWVVVQGNTTTAAAGSLAAFYRRVRVAHVEAGLRTGDRFHPFPEEINRRIADVVADLHFAPTERARQSLLAEGISEATIEVTGNTVIDALVSVVERDWPLSPELAGLVSQHGQRLILVTAHRRESFGEPMANICRTVRQLAAERDDVAFVLPVHPNPNVRATVGDILAGVPRVVLTEPLDYFQFVVLLKRSYLVLTDSGGLQEEAPSLGKPVLVMREVTERPEAIEAGSARLVGTDPRTIGFWVNRLLDEPAEYGRMARVVNPFGDGKARKRIVNRILAEASRREHPLGSPRELANAAASPRNL